MFDIARVLLEVQPRRTLETGGSQYATDDRASPLTANTVASSNLPERQGMRTKDFSPRT